MDFGQLFKNLFKKQELQSSAWVQKDRTGQWWFVGIYTNKWIDSDNEILSEESHKEYIQWIKETGFQPSITAYHLPRTKDPLFWPSVFALFEDNIPALQKMVDAFYKPIAFAKATRVMYLDGFVVVLGKFLPGKEGIAERLSTMKDLGMSHGFINKKSDANIFKKYRTFEMSVLRNARAANKFTLSGALMQKGFNMAGTNEKGLTAEDRAVLEEIFGKDAADALEAKGEKGADVLSRALAFKDAGSKEEKTEEQPEQQKEEEAPADEKQEEAPALTVEVVAKAAKETFEQVHKAMTELQERLEKVEKENGELRQKLETSAKEVEQIKQSEDQKIASAWLPSWDWRGGYSATKAEDNLIESKEEKKELEENKPAGSAPKPKNEIVQVGLGRLFDRGLGMGN